MVQINSQPSARLFIATLQNLKSSPIHQWYCRRNAQQNGSERVKLPIAIYGCHCLEYYVVGSSASREAKLLYKTSVCDLLTVFGRFNQV